METSSVCKRVKKIKGISKNILKTICTYSKGANKQMLKENIGHTHVYYYRFCNLSFLSLLHRTLHVLYMDRVSYFSSIPKTMFQIKECLTTVKQVFFSYTKVLP